MKDAELVLRARGGDELAFRRLLDRCHGLIGAQLNEVFAPKGMEFSDLRQEALLGMHKAVRDYRADRGSSFRTFAKLCIERQLQTAIKVGTVRSSFSELEQRIVAGLAEGLSYDEIAAINGVSAKTVDNAAQRGRRKLAAAMELAA